MVWIIGLSLFPRQTPSAAPLYSELLPWMARRLIAAAARYWRKNSIDVVDRVVVWRGLARMAAQTGVVFRWRANEDFGGFSGRSTHAECSRCREVW